MPRNIDQLFSGSIRVYNDINNGLLFALVFCGVRIIDRTAVAPILLAGGP
jgi:hypothetical protein